MTFSGPTCVVPNVVYQYTAINWTNTSMEWCITGGTILDYGSCRTQTPYPQVYVKFTGGPASVKLSANQLSYTLNITVANALIPGDVSPAVQTINWGQPGSQSILCSQAQNGSCTPSHTYQWQKSESSVGFTDIVGATSQNLVLTSGPSNTTYYHRRVIVSPEGTVGYSDTAIIIVNPPLGGGSTTPVTQVFENPTLPSPLNTTTAFGGGCSSYTYQWESSSDIGFSAPTSLSNGTGLNYTFGTAPTRSRYYRRKCSCVVNQIGYSNIVSVIVTFKPGTLNTSQSILPGGAVTGLSISGASGGFGSSYTYQWQKSTDEINWTVVTGQTGSSYTPPIPTATLYYRVRVTADTDEIFSNTISIAVGSTPKDNKPNGSVSTATLIPVSMPAYPSGTDAANMNYVKTRVFANPNVGDLTTANSQTSKFDVSQTTTYLDGLGRDMQTVVKSATPQGKDMISTNYYDQYGRVVQSFLPYTDDVESGNFRTNANTAQPTFYNTYLNNSESFYYSSTQYDNSPLNKPLMQTAPGKSWGGNNKGVRSVQRTNRATENARLFTIASTSGAIPVHIGTYNAGELLVTETTDEHENKVLEYQQRDGLTVLKKVQVSKLLQETHGGWLCTYYVYDDFKRLRYVLPPKAVAWLSNGNNWSNLSTNPTLQTELCFRHEYDAEGRMVVKVVPGAGEVWMVYDRRDRLAFTQDARMRSSNQWMANLYDELNRPILTGMITYTGNRAALQTAVDGNLTQSPTVSVTRTAPAPIGKDLIVNTLQSNTKSYEATNSITMDLGFDSDNSSDITLKIQDPIVPVTPVNETVSVNENPIQAGFNLIVLTQTWYDGYTFNSNAAQSYSTPATALTGGTALYPVTTPTNAQQALVQVRGMVTGTTVRTLPDPGNLSAGVFLQSVVYYDDRGRVLQTSGQNYKGGIDKTTNLYDYPGQLLCSKLEHYNPQHAETSLQQITVQTNYSYDHGGRIIDVNKKINNATAKLLSTSTYDALGRLTSKGVGRKSDNSGPIETLDYNYNIRGWLKGINRDYATTPADNSRWFGMELNYDWGFAYNQYNGNASGAKWRSKGDGVQRSYGYGYDKVNRLVSGDFAQGATYIDDSKVDFDMNLGTFTSGQYIENTAYDENGNILLMQQKGLKVNASSLIDNLTYTYNANSNKLKNVIEASGVNDPLTKLGDFRISQTYLTTLGNPAVKPATAIDYSYDFNGNLSNDLNKDIQNIQYNHLNLPWKITVTNKGTITYIYDATGNKLEKITSDITVPPAGTASGNKATTYLSSIIYQNNLLQFLGHEEGRARVITSSANVCDFFIKDHLGNTRMVLTDEVQIDRYPTVTLEGSGAGSPVEKEKAYFDINSSYVVNKPTNPNPATLLNYLNDNGTNNPNTFANKTAVSEKMYQLNAATNRTGLSTVLKVMSGDKLDILGKSYYRYNSETINNTPFDATALINAFLGVASGANSAVQHGATVGALTGNSGGTVIPLNNFTNSNPPTTNNIKAGINYIIFDEQFNFVNGGFDAVDPASTGGLKAHFLQNISIPKNGYIYIYCSNESNINVFFDNLELVHTRGPLLEETHYYPFGLTMSGISSKAATLTASKNLLKFKGKEMQQGEFSDGSGLELVDFGARMYDNQLGRWQLLDPLASSYNNTSPYAFVKNNPINNIEIDGRYFDEKNKKKSLQIDGQIDKKISKLEKDVVKAEKQGKDVSDLKARIEELKNSKADIKSMDSDQKTEYRYGSTGSKEAKEHKLKGPSTLATGKNEKGDNIITMFSEKNMGSVLHEQRHGGQSARGEINVLKQEGTLAAEISSYKAQYSWDGKLDYSSHNIDQTTALNRGLLDRGMIPPEAVKNIKAITEINANMVRDIGEFQTVSNLNLILRLYNY